MTEETRDIAGVHCHRANAIILDSVYIIAFYTDQILTNGGPESFCGLPCMILGIAIPRIYTTWFATSVNIQNIPAAKLSFPASKSDKVYNSNGLKEQAGILLGTAKKSYTRLLIEMLLYETRVQFHAKVNRYCRVLHALVINFIFFGTLY